MKFKFFRPKPSPTASASTGGRVVYAVGDIHGHLDLLEDLLGVITRDFAALNRQDQPVLVFVGDYVDRGPASRGVIDRLIALTTAAAERGVFEVRALMGNHEQTMLSFLDNPEAGAAWVEFGGGETMTSYGVVRPVGRVDQDAWREIQSHFQARVPASHVAFLQGLELSATYGDYFFTHAGVRPGVPLDRQTPEDLMWIRNDFLSQPHRLPCVVVHGHTPDEEPYIGRDRINIDTGAYATGVLTAVRLIDGPPVILQARKSRRV
ncbi:MAG: hypothetical protein B7Z44_18015 [Caulobacter sp. 12-67-6]|nr:MAG: hypothetical protein B7Z44_18015 [Caulobacter sp. 12-67-6]OYX67959.1 MAG: hypothetical protein B7Y81_18050 [Caulobacter sp. 32-67-35]OYX93377.1 MAG: hypothetical protein B7Y78_08585 [Caulobacter sp. 35-67-4]OZA77770.1 MAG: hypothetical protein B7X77_04245 [Caulobacter sp. 39-67-4]HQR87764.1 metallophosphoesterase family protein [Caulobacter sp.]